MIPLADMHCHLLAGLDDGPRTSGEALEMCQLAYAEGTRMVAALAHQNPRYRGNTPQRIQEAVAELTKQLHDADIPLTVYPSAEIMVHPGLPDEDLRKRYAKWQGFSWEQDFEAVTNRDVIDLCRGGGFTLASFAGSQRGL